MLLDNEVTITTAAGTVKYWQARGYQATKQGEHLTVKVQDLPPKSNATVRCRCDDCGEEYLQRFSRNHNACQSCAVKTKMSGNKNGSGNRGKPRPQQSGELHPRWNKNKSAFKAYAAKVRKLTEENYARDIDKINPHRLPRTLCGVEGGYQLDHRVSVKKGFEMGINPIIIASTQNLEMLTWRDNRDKWG